MASSRIYLSGAAKRKQRQIRNQNEAKSLGLKLVYQNRGLKLVYQNPEKQ